MPAIVTVCGLPAALSVMVKAPVLVPPAVGLKVTLSVQVVLTGTLEPQVWVWEKSPLDLRSRIRVGSATGPRSDVGVEDLGKRGFQVVRQPGLSA
jgi:hypothetical protein